jgi:hypothetical protein
MRRRKKNPGDLVEIDGVLYSQSEIAGLSGPMSTPRFWQSVSEAEFDEICKTSCLNAELCARLWRFLDRQGPPPKRLMILIQTSAKR